MLAESREVLCAMAAASSAVAGAVCDVRSRKIPNRLTGFSLLGGVVLHVCLGGMAGLGSALAAGLLAGAFFLLFHVAGGMGAGDVKLMAAVACLGGWPQLQGMLLATVVSGFVLAVGLALYHGRLRETAGNALLLGAHHWRHGVTAAEGARGPALHMPFGVPIACGCLFGLGMQFHQLAGRG